MADLVALGELLMVTRGPKGADYLTQSHHGHVHGFEVEAIDAIGAGDSFMAAVLNAVVQNPELARRTDDLESALRRANACAALTVTRHGAIPALPGAAELELFLATPPPEPGVGERRGAPTA